MNREIKFRAWDQRDWQEHRHSMRYFKDLSDLPGDINQGGYEFMQYTGLKDKNGVEIYEGDIVQFEYDGEVQPEKCTIVFDRGSFLLKDKLPGSGYSAVQHRMVDRQTPHIVVIGNIYENNELLEAKS